jgi:Tfp pilus assembly protein PilW
MRCTPSEASEQGKYSMRLPTKFRMWGMAKDKGYTLVELVMVMAIFIVVIMAITTTFNHLLNQASQQGKSATSQIEGIAGLEMFRTDVAHAGFALPWAFSGGTPSAYKEIADNAVPAGVTITASNFNDLRDIPPALPRAVAGAVTTGGSNYLVIKSALLSLNSPSVGRWGYVNYSTNGAGDNLSYISRINDPVSEVQANQDRLVSIRSSFSTTGTETKSLLVNAAGTFSYTVPSPSYMAADNAFKPTDASESVFSYAISNVDLLMPYNRADYYIDFAATKPTSCNPGTGILTKAVADQNGGYGTTSAPLVYPLLSCVGDLQVVFALDMDDDGVPGTYADVTGNNVGGTEGASTATVQGTLSNADLLRQRLATVYVYVLAQEGMRDRDFSYPVTDPAQVIMVGGNGLGKTWTQTQMVSTFGSDWLHYRWKVYGIAVTLKNLQ